MGAEPLGYGQIGLAALLVGFAALVSYALRLRLEGQLAVAAARSVAQLLLVGYILRYVLAARSAWLVLAAALAMASFATRAAVGRPRYAYAGIGWDVFGTLALSSFVTAAVVTSAIVQVHPWYRPQYAVPLLGMILGNSLTGVSIAQEQLLGDLARLRGEIEMELSLGASAWEAASGPLRSAVRRGLTPTINSMLVVGIVSLPGMMTGQILAGSDPLTAVKYQIVVLFMLAAATALSCMLIALLTCRRVFNAHQQLDESRLRERKAAG